MMPGVFYTPGFFLSGGVNEFEYDKHRNQSSRSPSATLD
jgi:hypothetical protein